MLCVGDGVLDYSLAGLHWQYWFAKSGRRAVNRKLRTTWRSCHLTLDQPCSAICSASDRDTICSSAPTARRNSCRADGCWHSLRLRSKYDGQLADECHRPGQHGARVRSHVYVRVYVRASVRAYVHVCVLFAWWGWQWQGRRRRRRRQWRWWLAGGRGVGYLSSHNQEDYNRS